MMWRAIALLGAFAAQAAPAQGPLVAAYGARLARPTLNKTEAAMVQALNAKRPADASAKLALDPALCLAAAAHAAQFADGAEPDTFADGLGSVRYWLDAAGVSTRFVRGACATVAASAKPEAMLEALEPDLETAGMTHVGVGSTRAGEHVAVTVIVAKRLAQLDPIPLRPNPGETYRLAGKLHESLHGCTVLLTDPSGQTRRVAQASGREFDCELTLADKPGLYVVEVVGVGDRGPVLADVLRLHAGRAFPAPFAQQPRPPRAEPAPAKAETAPSASADPAKIAEKLILDISHARMALAIQPLQAHPVLKQIATYNSQDMRRRGAKQPESRLAHVHMKSLFRCQAYKVAGFVGPRPPSVEKMRLATNRVFTHVGVGIAKGQLDGKEVMWGTLIFARK